MVVSHQRHDQPIDLRHLPTHRVLLCVPCGYCVLLKALDTHLKCIHHIPSIRRQVHIKHARTLHLANIQEVIYPDPQKLQIPGLPCFDGYVCEAPNCTYISITTKRMQAHWTIDHYSYRQKRDIDKYKCRPVRLQTFFRGSNLRYFVVSEPPIDTWPPRSSNHRSIETLLMKHFFEHTYDSVRPVKGTGQQWKGLVMRQCQTHEFLRYAILSITACHFAHDNPAQQRQVWALQADRYRRLAIKTIPQWSEEEQQNHFFTQFNFLRLVDLGYLAREQVSVMQKQQQLTTVDHSKSPPSSTVLSDWVSVSRRGREIWFRHRGEGREAAAMCAMVTSFEQILQMSESDLALNPYDQRLATLTKRLLSHTPSCTYIVDTACVTALDLLRRAWAIPYHDPSLGFRDTALLWLASVPDRFLQLVRDHDPVALVILAHHCTLWTLAEDSHWYMKHRAESIISTIRSHLGREWLPETSVAVL